MAFDADDENKVAQRDRELELLKLQEASDLQEVMKSKAGRRLIWRILGWTHLYQTSLVGPNNAVFAAEGERNIGIKLVVELEKHAFEDYIRMKREHGANK